MMAENILAAGPISLTSAQILCCQCGVLIEPNPSNTCIGCLRTQVDCSSDIEKHATLSFCKGCERYLVPPSTWVLCALESQELIRICLKRLRGLSRVHLVDAGFIWTEPHSKRIKVKLTVQKEVLESIIQQVIVVEYTVHDQMCDECHRREAQDFWRAVVQVRQKTSHKRTFLYLEQMILKHRLHTSALRIKETHEGLDLFYATKQEARKLVDFITSSVPSKLKTSQELVSHDIHNNKFQYKHTFSLEIVPVSKNDLVCLPVKLTQSLGLTQQIIICSRVSSSLQLLDPSSNQMAELPSYMYWKYPFNTLCQHRQYVEFFVLRIENSGGGEVADAWVVPVAKLGQTDTQFHCRTHLGRILSDGDIALGFDFTTSNLNDPNIDLMKSGSIPDVVLIKKSYGDRQKRHKMRNWQIKHLDKEKMEMEVSRPVQDQDYAEFLEDIEEDLHYRKNVNVYFDPSKVLCKEEGLAPDAPYISVEEMLKDLSIHDADTTQT